MSRRFASRALTVVVVLAAVCWLLFARPPLFGGSLSYIIVSGDSMLPTLRGGDLVLARDQAAYAEGDVLAYEVPEGEPGAGVLVIHRVVGGSADTGYVLRGDNRDDVDPWRPRPSEVRGKMVASVPRVGLLLGLLATPLTLAVLAALLAFFLALPPRRRAEGGRVEE